ncbi:MAG: hypothetical protein AAGD32_06390 [Planctomycetota bacterium]
MIAKERQWDTLLANGWNGMYIFFEIDLEAITRETKEQVEGLVEQAIQKLYADFADYYVRIKRQDLQELIDDGQLPPDFPMPDVEDILDIWGVRDWFRWDIIE